MAFAASGLVAYARSLADLVNSKFISYSDGLTLLNEGYRDIYNLMTESSGDYFTKDFVFTLTSINKDPNSLTGNEYLYTPPADFYKLRFLSYNTGSNWANVDRFSGTDRNNNPGKPMYRMKNGQLWLIVPNGSAMNFKITYYTPPAVATFPNDDIAYASAIAVYNQSGIQAGSYIDSSQVSIYIYGKSILAESLATGVVSTLYTSTNAIANVIYYAGYIYWLDLVTLYIFRAPTDLTTLLVPVNLLISNVDNFLIQNNLIYASISSGLTNSFTLSGTYVALLLALRTIDLQLFNGLLLYIRKSDNIVVYNGVASTATASAIVNFGGQAFIWDAFNNLSPVSFDPVSFIMTVGTLPRLTNLTTLGVPNGSGYVPNINNANPVVSSLVIDTQFTYPTNEVNEIMAYTLAVAMCRKQTDQEKIGLLQARLTELLVRFSAVNKQDEYQFQRINNGYDDLPIWY